MSDELNITPNTKVSLNFSITLETGEVVDTNFDRARSVLLWVMVLAPGL